MAQTKIDLSRQTDLTVASGSTLAVAAGGFLTIADAPSSATDAVNKSYVDNLTAGLSWKTSVRVKNTNTDTDIATNNGTGGAWSAGQFTWTTGPTTFNGVSLTNGDRILVTHQTAGQRNGIYVRTSQNQWDRATDADNSPGNELNGAAVFVEAGTAHADTGWTQTADVTTINTTAQTWTQFTGATVVANLDDLGDVVKADNNVLTISLDGAQNLTLNGDLTVEAGSTAILNQDLTTDATNVQFASLCLTSTATVDGAIRANGGITTSDGGPLALTSESGQAVNICGTSAGVNIDGTAISLDGSAASNFTVAGAQLQLSTTTSGEIDITSAGAVDINASGAITLDSTAASNFTVDGAALTLSTTTSGNINIESAGDAILKSTATNGSVNVCSTGTGSVKIVDNATSIVEFFCLAAPAWNVVQFNGTTANAITSCGFATGLAACVASQSVSLLSGLTSGASGNTANSGNVEIQSGGTDWGNSGNLLLCSGASSVCGTSGNITISTGTAGGTCARGCLIIGANNISAASGVLSVNASGVVSNSTSINLLSDVDTTTDTLALGDELVYDSTGTAFKIARYYKASAPGDFVDAENYTVTGLETTDVILAVYLNGILQYQNLKGAAGNYSINAADNLRNTTDDPFAVNDEVIVRVLKST